MRALFITYLDSTHAAFTVPDHFDLQDQDDTDWINVFGETDDGSRFEFTIRWELIRSAFVQDVAAGETIIARPTLADQAAENPPPPLRAV